MQNWNLFKQVAVSIILFKFTCTLSIMIFISSIKYKYVLCNITFVHENLRLDVLGRKAQ